MVVIRWLLVTAYVAFIFIFSQSPASSAGSMADWLLNMFPFLDNYDLGMVVLYLRKLIHIGGYFLAAVLFYAAAKVSPRLERFPAHTAFILAVLLAVCDESYQTRLTHRSGTVSDIFIDLVGISLGIISVKVYQNFKGRPKKASSS
ncbi:MAG: VanZ family protein [Candidatus Wallacebacter cryptica]|nr:VanZ family protein [Bacillota bacterium]